MTLEGSPIIFQGDMSWYGPVSQEELTDLLMRTREEVFVITNHSNLPDHNLRGATIWCSYHEYFVKTDSLGGKSVEDVEKIASEKLGGFAKSQNSAAVFPGLYHHVRDDSFLKDTGFSRIALTYEYLHSVDPGITMDVILEVLKEGKP